MDGLLSRMSNAFEINQNVVEMNEYGKITLNISITLVVLIMWETRVNKKDILVISYHSFNNILLQQTSCR